MLGNLNEAGIKIGWRQGAPRGRRVTPASATYTGGAFSTSESALLLDSFAARILTTRMHQSAKEPPV